MFSCSMGHQALASSCFLINLANLLCLPTGFKYPQNTVIHTCFLGKTILMVDRSGKSLYGEHYSRGPVITFFDLRS